MGKLLETVQVLLGAFHTPLIGANVQSPPPGSDITKLGATANAGVPSPATRTRAKVPTRILTFNNR